MRRRFPVGLGLVLAFGFAIACEGGTAPATQPAEAADLAGPDNGRLPGDDTTLAETMKGHVTHVLACKADGPARSELGFSGVTHASQTFVVLTRFYGDEKPGSTINVRYSYLDPDSGFARTARAVRRDEAVIWILCHDGFGGDRGVKALPDTEENRIAIQKAVEQLPAGLAKEVEAAKAIERLTRRLFAIESKGWSGGNMSQGKVQPARWDAGEGMVFRWSPAENGPESKVDDSALVLVWIMKSGYAGNRIEDPASAAKGSPAVEIGAWRGRRVFLSGDSGAWPTARADILKAITTDAATPPTTQPTTGLKSP